MPKKKRFWVVLIYLSLLAASYVVRIRDDVPKMSHQKKFEEISVEGGRVLRFAYKEYGKPAAGQLPVIMVHGSPGSAETFDGLVATLPERRILCVDLPGFGDSEHDIPDYSILAHAKYLRDFLDSKKIERAHFVGFSLGGGVILQLAEMRPESIGSITFVSSIGVQEYELFGDYYANRIVHGIQLGLAWIMRALTPHFGLFDRGAIEYSRNFFDTDQRPLRAILEKTEKPFLIVHGKDDPLVPVEAAREHSRIVPQSEYRELDDNHFFVFMRPEKISGILSDFWKRVESGRAATRMAAAIERVEAAGRPFAYQIVSAKGPVAFCFFLLILAVALVNQDVAAIFAGVFVAQGRFGFVMPLIAILFAIALGCSIWRRIARRRQGDVRRFLPAIFEASISKALGFRFQDYVLRSRDPFFAYIAHSVGLGIVRTSVIGIGAYLLAYGLILSGFAQDINTLVLASAAVTVYAAVAVFHTLVIKFYPRIL